MSKSKRAIVRALATAGIASLALAELAILNPQPFSLHK